jgi:hypothetical protein
MSNQVNNTNKDSASFGAVCVQFLSDMTGIIITKEDESKIYTL